MAKVLIPIIVKLLLVLDSVNSFEIVENYIDKSPFHIEGLSNFSSSLKHTWIVNSVIPEYIRDFLAISRSLNQDDNNASKIKQEFFEEIFDGVKEESCKVHVTQWFERVTADNSTRLLSEKDKWVLQMVDAWGKLPEGILSGHVGAAGDFDECLGISVEDLEILSDVPIPNDVDRNFNGQYCTSYILDYNTSMSITPNPKSFGEWEVGHGVRKLSNKVHESVSIGEFLKIMLAQKPILIPLIPSLAVCLPNSCGLPDVQQILVNGVHLKYKRLGIPEVNYTSLPWPVTVSCNDGYKPPLDAAAISVIVLLTIFVTLALVTGIIDYWNSNSSSNYAINAKLQTTTAYKYAMAFSFYTNTKKWLSTKRSPDDLGCLHGIRFFSTAWVVLGHTFGYFQQAPQWNLIDINNIYKNWTVLAVINGTFSVDTFFVMSGLLAAYNILKLLDKTKGKFNVPMFYVHRYLRLTPTYAILVAISPTLLTYTGNGPLWHMFEASGEFCKTNWWTNLLYINNLVKSKDLCNGESWYLANDMQFYVLSPFIVYPLWRKEVAGILLLAFYTVLSCIAPVLVLAYGNNVPPAMVLAAVAGADDSTEIYIRPWSRISTFLVGVWLGWILYKTKGKRVKISKPIVFALWATSTGTALAVIFGIYPWFDPNNEIPKVSGYFYSGLSRFSFGVAVALVIFACVKGYGGIVNRFLSWKAFMPLGRLCFCVYIISIHVQGIFHSRINIPIKWDMYTVINIYFAHMVMSYIVGYFCTLLFESPFITLQKLIFDGKSKENTNAKITNQITENNNVSLKDDTVKVSID